MQRSIIAPAERVTNLRWALALLIGFGVLVTACNQAGLAVNGARIQREFGIDDVALGYLFSAYGWAIAIAQIPFAFLLDRIGVKQIGRGVSVAFVIVSALSAFVSATFGTLVGLRAVAGVIEAPLLPAASKATGYWFPAAERSTATSFFDAPQKLAIALAIPLAAWIGATYSWRTMFLVTAIAGIVYAFLFFVFYRDPSDAPALTYAEKQHISKGDAQSEEPAQRVNILGLRSVWGITIGFFAYAFAFSLFITWLPDYIARVFHVGAFTSATEAALPWLLAAVADVVIGGVLIDAAIKGGNDATAIRKIVLIAGMVLGLAVFGAVSAHDHTVALISVSVAIVGLGISGPVAWSLPSLIAPRGHVGAVASMMRCGGALGAVVAPIAAGYIVQFTHSFDDVFITASAALLIGILSYALLLGKIEEIRDGEPAGILI